MVLELVLAAGAVVLAARSVLADNMEVCGTALSAFRAVLLCYVLRLRWFDSLSTVA